MMMIIIIIQKRETSVVVFRFRIKNNYAGNNISRHMTPRKPKFLNVNLETYYGGT